MNVIYFGSDVQFPCFSYMLQNGITITDLYTYHEASEYICEKEIAECARKHHIPVHYERMTPALAKDLFATRQCDLFFSAEYDSYIPVVDDPAYRGVNIHNSLLPEGKGYFPIEMRLFYGYNYGGVTMHKIAEKIDHGDIILQHRFPILETDNDRRLYEICSEHALEMTKEFFQSPEEYWKNATPQQGEGSYWKKPTLEQTMVTPFMTTKEIWHVYRAMGHFTKLFYNESYYHIEELTFASSTASAAGTLLHKTENELTLQVADGTVTFLLQI